ncbi:hypothetical protein ACTFIR_007210 [Dictyostelium discoideum]
MNETNWKSLIENLPIYNKNGNDCSKIKTMSMGKRMISRNYLNHLYKENGDILETIEQDQIKSNPFLKDEISNQKIIFKFQPQFPSMELTILNFVKLLFKDDDINNDVLKSEDKDEKLKKLDSYCFSKLIITTILTNPANGCFENYLFTPMKNGNFKLVSMNNELSFVPESTQTIKTGIFSSEISFCVNTCLFMLEQMHNPIDKEIINKLKSLDVLTFLKKWISSIGVINKQINNLIHKDGNCEIGKKKPFIHRSENNKTYPLTKFPEGSIKLLYSKLIRLKEVLINESTSSKKPITFWKLLTILEPLISNRMYINRPCYKTKASVIENYNWYLRTQDISRNHEPMPLISSKIKVSRGINKKNKNQYGLKDLELIDEEITFYKNISSNTMDHHTLFNQFQFYLNVLPLSKDIRYLKFLNNEYLTNKLLISSQFLNGLKRLEICDCKNLKQLSNGSDELKLPTVSKMLVSNCTNLKTINIFTLSLKTLNIKNCESLKEFQVYAPVLEKLKLQSTLITSKLLLKLDESKYLKYINFSNSTINGVSKSIDSLSNSICLDVWENLIEFKAINLKSLSKITISKELKHLKLLDFNGCSTLVDIFNFKRNGNGLVPSLEILNLNGTTLEDNEKQLIIFNNLKNK